MYINLKKLDARKIIQFWQNRIKIFATFKLYVWNFSRRLNLPVNLLHYFSSNRSWLGNTNLEVSGFVIPSSLLQL